MIIEVKGSTAKKRKLVEEASHFYERLLFKRKLPSLSIEVELINRLTSKEDAIGDCIWEDSRTRPREFTIRLDSHGCISELLETLAHEMVHIKQFALGEMIDSRVNYDIVTWHGEEFDSSKVDYYDYPWEIEAHGRERGLFVRYMREYGYTQEKWAKGFV